MGGRAWSRPCGALPHDLIDHASVARAKHVISNNRSVYVRVNPRRTAQALELPTG